MSGARNLRPTAPALVAIAIFGRRYAGQRGGSMEFWDSLPDADKRLCTEWAERISSAPMMEHSNGDLQ
jgi:hypothetical protein